MSQVAATFPHAAFVGRSTGSPAGIAPVSAGTLVGRPDLTEEIVMKAIAERLAFDGRTGPDPEVVIEAARLGKRKALAFLRKLVLPPPEMRLQMPIQPILRSHLAEAAAVPARAVPTRP